MKVLVKISAIVFLLAAMSPCEGEAQGIVEDREGFIDKTGKVIIPCKYGFAHNFSDGLAPVTIKYDSGRYIFIR